MCVRERESVCVCVCVCERERTRGMLRESLRNVSKTRKFLCFHLFHPSVSSPINFFRLKKLSIFLKQKLITQGACIIKLITAVIYGYSNKLECSTLNTRLRLGRLDRDKHSSFIMETVNYGRNKFYDTGPRAQCYKTNYIVKLQLFFIALGPAAAEDCAIELLRP
jgi:hypothetical protein